LEKERMKSRAITRAQAIGYFTPTPRAAHWLVQGCKTPAEFAIYSAWKFKTVFSNAEVRARNSAQFPQ
jgi:hypothetical protein